MSDFKVIETQEQLDRIIGDRIKRAEQKAAEKYSDYDALKTQNADYAAQISQLNEQIQKQSEASKGTETEIADLKKKVQSYETASVKTKIALEMGIPYQMASRLNGSTEEEIRADADGLAQLIGKGKPVAPLGSSEPVANGNKEDAAWKKFAASFNSND